MQESGLTSAIYRHSTLVCQLKTTSCLTVKFTFYFSSVYVTVLMSPQMPVVCFLYTFYLYVRTFAVHWLYVYPNYYGVVIDCNEDFTSGVAFYETLSPIYIL